MKNTFVLALGLLVGPPPVVPPPVPTALPVAVRAASAPKTARTLAPAAARRDDEVRCDKRSERTERAQAAPGVRETRARR